MSDSRVVALRAYRVAHRLAEPQGNAGGYYDLRESLVVELVDRAGRSGWGETWHSPAGASAVLRDTLAPRVLGADGSRPRALANACAQARGYDRGGITTMATSALEMAAWDLAARARGVPLHELLGGALRARVPAYAAGPYFRPGGDPLRDYSREAEVYVAAGFRAIKAKIGLGPSEDERALRAIAGAVGPGVALMADANQGYRAGVAIESARRTADLGLRWLEEPVPPEDVDGYRRICEAAVVDVAGGEALGESTAFRTLLDAGVGVLQPDISICGGVVAMLDSAALARARGAAIVPHVWGTGINLHATLQLLAVLPAAPSGAWLPYPWLELDRSPNPLRTLFGEPAPGADGCVAIPDAPGIGIDVRAERFAPFLKDSWSVERP